jgi:hypothetical protein
MPNALAHIAILGWPLLSLVLFVRMPAAKAAAISIVAGYLLLPRQPVFGLPVLPALNKETSAMLVPLVAVAAMCLVRDGRGPLRGPFVAPADALPGFLPRDRLILGCLVLLGLGLLGTVLTNGAPITFPLRRLPGLTLYDAGAMALTIGTGVLPFFIARKLFASPESHVLLLKVICAAALAYAVAVIWEARMSPQLNRQVYGFFPSAWVQHLRDGGFRPIVFLNHGLKVGIVLATGALAGLALSRLAVGRAGRIGGLAAALALLVVLGLSKNVGATLLAILAFPLMLFLGARWRLLAAAAVMVVVLLYPMGRTTGLVPTDAIMSGLSRVVAEGRIASLGFRLRNEDVLLAKANEKPLFGWGGWSRARIYDAEGRNVSTPDGTWVIAFGERGWVGYVAFFGLLTVPTMALALRRREDREAADLPDAATAGLALILAVNMVDLIPNSGISPITWLMAGALAGRLEWRAAAAGAQEREVRAAGPPPGRAAAIPFSRPAPDLDARPDPRPARSRLPYARDLREGERRVRGRDGMKFRRPAPADGRTDPARPGFRRDPGKGDR